MAKLLNNKYAVIGLVLAAISIIYFRVVGPAMEFFFPEQIEAEVFTWDDSEQILEAEAGLDYQQNPERELQFASEQFNLTKIDISGLRWNESPSRDPFSQTKQITSVAPVAALLTTSLNATETRLPRVSAIVNSPKLKFAVIEGEILKEGDRYENFVLKQIESKQVSILQVPNQKWHRLSITE